MKKCFMKLASLVATVITMMFSISCTEEHLNEVNSSNVYPISWTPEHSSYNIHIGESLSVNGTLVYSNGKKTPLKGLCTSLDPDIVKASNSFEAIGLKPGSARVLAQVRFVNPTDISEYIHVFESEVTVEVIPEANTLVQLELTPSEITIAHGESFTYVVTAIYGDGRRKEIDPSLCEWTVEDDGEQHLSYGNDGVVTGHQGAGETIITATYSKEGTSVSASSIVIVEDRHI